MMITDGGEAIADIDILRHQQEVLGPVASPPTVWRTLDELGPAPLRRIEKARAATRARVWDLLPGGLPAAGWPGRPAADGRPRRGRHHRDRALGEGTGHPHVQEDVRVPPDRGVVRQHQGDAGGLAAAGQRRLEHHHRPHRGADRRDRPGPRLAPARSC